MFAFDNGSINHIMTVTHCSVLSIQVSCEVFGLIPRVDRDFHRLFVSPLRAYSSGPHGTV